MGFRDMIGAIALFAATWTLLAMTGGM